MEHYSKSRKPSQANKQKLAENLTGVEHGPTPKRSPKTVVKTAELAKRSHIKSEPLQSDVSTVVVSGE